MATDLTPGYWCECTTDHGEPNSTFTASFVAYAPHQAVRWIRVALRTITPALDRQAASQAWAWLSHGHHQAAKDLSEGSACALTLRQGTTVLT